MKRKLRYALGFLLSMIIPFSLVFGLAVCMNGWGATFAIFGIVISFVGMICLGLYLMTSAKESQ